MRAHKKTVYTLLIFLSSALCFSLLLFFAYSRDNKYTDKCIQPISGLLYPDEESLENDLFFLANQWQFYPDAALTPMDFKQGLPEIPMEFVTIGKFNDFSRGSKNSSPYGKAAYRLVIELPEKENVYSLLLPEIYSSYRLYINQDLVFTMGNPDSKERETGRHTISFSASGRTEILIQAANYDHYYSGMTYPPVFGTSDNVQRYQYTKLFLHSTAIVLLLLLSAFSLYFFLKLRDRRAGIFCIMSLLVSIYISYPVFYTFFHVKNSFWYGLELFTTYAIYFLYVYLQHIFLNLRARGYQIFSYLLLAFSAAAFLYGTFFCSIWQIHTVFPICVAILKILVSVYLAANILYAGFCGEDFSLFVPALTGMVCASFWADRLLPLYEPKYGGFFPEYCSIAAVTAGAFFLWFQLADAYRLNHFYEEEKKRFSTQVALQKVHYDELTKKIEESARQRHDMRHHLHTVYQFLEVRDTVQAMEYLREYDKNMTVMQRETLCSHPIADALLQYYEKLCTEKHIGFKVMLGMPANLPMEDTDISILFGNLLENAYEACLEYDRENPYIKIWGRYKEPGFLFRIENTFSTPLKERNGKYHSTKHDGPGIGTESVRKVVQQYNGTVDFSKEEHIFQVSVILDL